MLTLPIKKKWFDMIRSGEKKEEYRDIKPYYTSRFRNNFAMYPYSTIPCVYDWDRNSICFRNGYSKDSPSFAATCTLTIGEGKPEWGAEPGKIYYILRILEVREI
jgi:hypothetical protein